MEFIKFFSAYFLHLFFGAFVIVGWFAVTRGEYKKQPDGSMKKVGKVLKGWYFFWMAEWPSKKRLYFQGEELNRLIAHINTITPSKLMPTRIDMMSVTVVGAINSMLKDEIHARMGVLIQEKNTATEGEKILFFYREEPNYVYPWYIRDMLAGCVTCHSSWLGSICYWFPFLLVSKVKVFELFSFAQFPIAALFVTWLAYCVSLAFLTTALWKKYMA